MKFKTRYWWKNKEIEENNIWGTLYSFVDEKQIDLHDNISNHRECILNGWIISKEIKYRVGIFLLYVISFFYKFALFWMSFTNNNEEKIVWNHIWMTKWLNFVWILHFLSEC